MHPIDRSQTARLSRMPVSFSNYMYLSGALPEFGQNTYSAPMLSSNPFCPMKEQYMLQRCALASIVVPIPLWACDLSRTLCRTSCCVESAHSCACVVITARLREQLVDPISETLEAHQKGEVVETMLNHLGYTTPCTIWFSNQSFHEACCIIEMNMYHSVLTDEMA